MEEEESRWGRQIHFVLLGKIELRSNTKSVIAYVLYRALDCSLNGGKQGDAGLKYAFKPMMTACGTEIRFKRLMCF